MTDGVETSKPMLTAAGPNDVTLAPQYPEGKKDKPELYKGAGTYTVSNTSDETLQVLVSATLAPAPAPAPTPGAAAPAAEPTPLKLPFDAITVTPAKVTLQPNENAQAKVELKLPPQAEGQRAVLSVHFRDELRPNNIAVTYSSNVSLQGGGKRPFSPWLIIVPLILLILIGGSVAAFILLGGGDKVAIPPNLVGMTEKDATAALAKACEPQPCLKAKSESREDKTAPAGSVIATDPKAPAEVDVGSTVTLVVSGGVPVSVPDVKGKTRQEAEKLLKTACTEVDPCLTADVKTQQSGEVGHGLVIESDPAAGGKARAGGRVTLVVSLGQPVTLPPVENKKVDNAIKDLQELCEPVPCLGITVVRTVSDKVSLNNAIETQPAAGSEVNPDSTVKLFVSNTLTGSIKIPWPYTADIDEGRVFDQGEPEADLWFRTTGYLTSGYPAESPAASFLLPVTPKAQGFEKCSQLSEKNITTDHVAVASLSEGDYFCIRTSRKTVGEIEVLSKSPSFDIAYTLWIKDVECRVCDVFRKDITIGPKIATKLP
jgi:beta-lactam-binding protein with PASTA domain